MTTEVEGVRARADIVDVVGELVALKRSGKEYYGHCPFHESATRSFYVMPSEYRYRCDGCGAGGDVFEFVMQRLGLDFERAISYVAVRSGVEC